MAKVPLRVYNHDIEKLIESRHTQEAVAHCKQILKFYPKHIDTYRLLGKAFLESQRYGEASDILQRVLSVVPDDFISQLGMSIIREDEGDLDGAIYHMERAFEVQPANTAIQEELRRLYGNRDGIQPPKIRLTRGALVRMYGRGELFPQAIAEAAAALAEDPQRVDMQVLLGRLYYQSGQKVKATEVCSQLVDKLPYCYEANRILADVLPGTSRPEDAQVYLERLRALDPYLGFISEAQPTSTDVSDNAVMVEQLEYDPEQDEPARPGWTQQVGLAWEEPAAAEEKPDWMAGELPAAEGTNSLPAQPTEEPPAQAAEIPDWMAAAGWKPSSGEEVETHLTLDDSNEDLVAPAEMPDWLQDLAPQQTAGTEQAAEDVEEDAQWLDQILSPGMPAAPQTDAPLSAKIEDVPAAEDADVPDWLKDLESPVAEDSPASQPETAAIDWFETPSAEVSEANADETTASPVPEWLTQDLNPESVNTDETTTSSVPEWLTQDIQSEPVNTDEVTASSVPEWLTQDINPIPAETGVDAQADELPEWLQDQKSADVSGEPHAVEAAPLPDWLQDIAQQSTAEVEPAVSEDRAPEMEIPQTEEAEIPASSTPEMEFTLPQEVSSQPIAPPDDLDAALAWLESLAARQGADEATLTTQPDQRDAEMPEWLQKEAQSAQAAEEMPQAALESEPAVQQTDETPSPTNLVPDWLQDQPTAPSADQPDASSVDQSALPSAPQSVTPSAPQSVAQSAAQSVAQPGDDIDAALAWMESLAARQGADEATLVTRPEDRVETAPEWVHQAEADTVNPTQPDVEIEAQTDLPEAVSTEMEAVAEPLLETASAEIDESIQLPMPEMGETAAELEAVLSDELPEAEPPEISAWMVEEETPIDQTQPVRATLVEEPPAVATTIQEEEEDDILPEWLRDLGSYSTDLEAGETQTDETMTEWMPEADFETPQVASAAPVTPEKTDGEPLFEPQAAVESPTASEEEAPFQPVAEINEPPAALVEEVPQQPEDTQPVAAVPASRAGELPERLQSAQTAMNKGDIETALSEYDNFIQTGELIEETIHDLRDALYRYPMDTNIWQSLGDVYMRSNRIQEALDAYTKAEELLR